MLWTVRVENGPRKVNHAAACIGDKIYSFGGYCASEHFGDWTPIPIYILDTTNFRWSTVQHDDNNYVPYQRYGHTVVVYQNKIYLWGGRNNHVVFKSLCCYDPATNEWSVLETSGRQPYPKDGHTACVINDTMYIFGGYENISSEYTKDVHALNFKTLKWCEIYTSGTSPSARDFHSTIVYGDRIYVYGGRSPDELENEYYCPKMHYLDTTTNHWHQPDMTGDIPVGRRSSSAWVYKKDIYVFGGFNSKLNKHYNDLYKYSIEANHWTLLDVRGHVPCQRRRQYCIMLDSKLYLFGGTRPHDHQSSDMEDLIDMSDLHVLDYQPSLKTLCILTALKYNLDQSCLPRDILWDILCMTMPNRISLPISEEKQPTSPNMDQNVLI